MIECGALIHPLILKEMEIPQVIFVAVSTILEFIHIANICLSFYFRTSAWNRTLGKIKFILIYLLLDKRVEIFFSFITEMKSADYAVSAGASGAVFAVMGDNALCSYSKSWKNSGYFRTTDDDHGRILIVFRFYKYWCR